MDSVVPNHYEIRIEPNLGESTFNATTIIHLSAKENINQIILHAVDLTISSCKMINKEETTDLKFEMDLNSEQMNINLTDKITGDFKIEFKYIGKLQENLKGLYKANYKIDEKNFVGLLTQFEQEDARRMFPCFDEPKMKTTFDLQVVADEELTVISNMPIKSESKLPERRKLVNFERTPKMSTYLLFLAIAHFESIKDTLGEIEVKVITHPGLTKFGKESLSMGIKALDFCQKYFNITYPLSKMDLIATPDFAAGAMENWGAISFREDALLIFPGSTSKLEEVMVNITIAHEISHQWFGNLVSPRIWKYIWLNESFADFFGTKIVDNFFPEIQVWDSYVGFQTREALTADAYIETVPIEIKGEDKAAYNIKTIPIIYSKGGSIIRMINDFIGDSFFQAGLQKYLNNHAYDVASSDDLWMALEEASQQPVSELMKTWVLQQGYPLLNVKRSENSLTFKQNRFTYLENDDVTLWMVPITVLFFSEDGSTFKKSFLLDKSESTFTIDSQFTAFKVNSEHTGFYRVKYSIEDTKTLGIYITNEKLSTLDGWNLVNDIYALLQSGNINLKYYLDFILHYTSEKYYTSIRSISGQLYHLFLLAPDKKTKQIVSEAGVTFHENYLNKIKYTPQENESFSNATIRNVLIKNAAFLGSQKTIDFCLKEFKKLQTGQTVPPDIIDSVLSVAARQNNDLDWFLNQFTNAKNEIEIINYILAMGEFSDNNSIIKLLDEIIFSKIPMRNLGYIISRLCMNPTAVSDQKMWKFFIANLDNIGKIHEFIQIGIINAIVTNPGVDKTTKLDMEKFFVDYSKVNPVAKLTTEKAFETLEINIRLKKNLMSSS